MRYKDKKNTIKRQKKAYDFLIRKGLESHHASAVVGNLMQESYAHLDSTVENEIGAVGIAQWLGPRRTDLENFAKQRGTSFKDFDTQLEFLHHELMNTGNSWGSKAQKEFFESKTAEEAAALFVSKFERSGEKPGDKGYDNRIRNAKSVYLQFNDNNIYAKDDNGNIVNVNPETATFEQAILSPKIRSEFYEKNFDLIEEKFSNAPKEAPAAEKQARTEIVDKAKEKIGQKEFIEELQRRRQSSPVPSEEPTKVREAIPAPQRLDLTPGGNEFFNFFLPEG